MRQFVFLRKYSRLISLTLLVGALGFGGVLRLGAARIPEGISEFWHWDWEYYGIGVQLAETGEFRPYPGWVSTAFRMPLYPAVISLIRRVRPGIAPLRLGQALLDWMAIAGVYSAGAMLGGGFCGGLASVFYAFSDVAVSQVAFPRIECMFGAIITLLACLLIRHVRKRGAARSSGICAAAIGMSFFCRSTLFLFPFFLAPLFSMRKQGSLIRTALILVLGSYCLLLPWMLRNAVLFRGVIPFENGAASLNFWGASVGMLPDPSVSELLSTSEYRAFLAKTQRASNSQRPRLFWDESLRNIARSPARFLGNFFRRLPLLWQEQWGLLLLALPLLALRPFPIGGEVIIFLLAYFNIYAFMGVTPRYARPVAGVACVAAALGIQTLVQRLTRQKISAANSPAPSWPGWIVGGLGVFLAMAYLIAAAQIFGEAWRWRRQPTYLPLEYRNSGPRYAALKNVNAAAIDLAFQGRWREADAVFSELLRREPLFGEALISRAVLRERAGDLNGAAADRRAALAHLEFPVEGAPPHSVESRLRQF